MEIIKRNKGQIKLVLHLCVSVLVVVGSLCPSSLVMLLREGKTALVEPTATGSRCSSWEFNSYANSIKERNENYYV